MRFKNDILIACTFMCLLIGFGLMAQSSNEPLVNATTVQSLPTTCNFKIILFGTDSPQDDNVNTNGGLLSGLIISKNMIGEDIVLTSKNDDLIFASSLDKSTYFLAGGSTNYKIKLTSDRTRFYLSPGNASYIYDNNGDYQAQMIVAEKNYQKLVTITSQLIVYRGVGFFDNVQNANAKKGIAIPNSWGKTDAFVNPYMHSGPPSNNNSIFTSWTTKYINAAYFALGLGGGPDMPDSYILQQKIEDKYAFGPRVGANNNLWEHEILLIGPQKATGVEPVQFSDFSEIGAGGMAILKYSLDLSLTKSFLDNINYGDEWQSMPLTIPCFIIGYKGNKYPKDFSNLASASAMLSQDNLEAFILTTENSIESIMPIYNDRKQNKWSTDQNGVLCLGLNRKLLPEEQLMIKNTITNEVGYSKKMRYLKNIDGIANHINKNDYPIIIINGPVGIESPIYGRQSTKSFIGDRLIRFYPNPASILLNIEGLGENTTIEIYDMLGKMVKTAKIHNETIDIGDLEKGMYSVKIVDLVNVTTQLLRIER